MADDPDVAPLRTEPDQRPDMQPPARPPKQTTSIYVSSGDQIGPRYPGPNIPLSPELEKIRMKAEIERIGLDNKLLDSQLALSQENWIKSYWRPIMGWSYIVVCVMDFIVFPALVMILPIYGHKHGVNIEYAQWQPLTLQFGGLYHMAMAAIMGVTAWTRGISQKTFLEK